MSVEQFSYDQFLREIEQDSAPGPDFSAYIEAPADKPDQAGAQNKQTDQQDMQQAVDNFTRRLPLSDKVRYISDAMINGEPHDPGRPSFPRNSELSETFMGLRSHGFSNSEIVGKINQQLTNGRSPLRVKLTDDGEIAQLDVVTTDGKKLLNGERIVTTYDGDRKERQRLKQLAERCATALNID